MTTTSSKAGTGRPWIHGAGVALAVVAGLLLIWMNLAVGVIGSEDNPANLMFAAVLAVAVLGAVIGRFRARGMARAMVAAAVVQVVVGVIALVGDMGAGGENWPRVIYVLTGFFTVLWLASAWLFRTAARGAAS